MSRNNIIGGMFGLEKLIYTTDAIPIFLRKPHILLINARSCIYLVNQIISPKNFWMPSYLCDVMLNAVKDSRLQYYKINYDLNIESFEWLSNIEDGDLVLLINYFGNPVDPDILKEIKKSGAWIIEDASQDLLSTNSRVHADFIIYSLRKFIGVPDGGILLLNKDIEIPELNLNPPPSDWWLKALYSVVIRREFDLHGGDKLWFKLFQQVDNEGPIGNYSMSELSQLIFKYCCDYSEISKKRKTNYKILFDILYKFCIFKEFNLDLVPIGFPIRLKNRDEVRHMLFENNIYPPVHWNIDNIVPEEFEESHILSSQIMTLPCDQRYGITEMEQMAEIVLKYAKNN